MDPFVKPKRARSLLPTSTPLPPPPSSSKKKFLSNLLQEGDALIPVALAIAVEAVTAPPPAPSTVGLLADSEDFLKLSYIYCVWWESLGAELPVTRHLVSHRSSWNTHFITWHVRGQDLELARIERKGSLSESVRVKTGLALEKRDSFLGGRFCNVHRSVKSTHIGPGRSPRSRGPPTTV